MSGPMVTMTKAEVLGLSVEAWERGWRDAVEVITESIETLPLTGMGHDIPRGMVREILERALEPAGSGQRRERTR